MDTKDILHIVQIQVGKIFYLRTLSESNITRIHFEFSTERRPIVIGSCDTKLMKVNVSVILLEKATAHRRLNGKYAICY